MVTQCRRWTRRNGRGERLTETRMLIRVAAGENVCITRHGKPVAEITAVKAPRNQLDDLALTDAAGTEGTRTGLLTAEGFTVLGVGFAFADQHVEPRQNRHELVLGNSLIID
jgi:antitoxin (DNA-binding transcriptional repressor) of toxin-antitoxin stability system